MWEQLSTAWTFARSIFIAVLSIIANVKAWLVSFGTALGADQTIIILLAGVGLGFLTGWRGTVGRKIFWSVAWTVVLLIA